MWGYGSYSFIDCQLPFGLLTTIVGELFVGLRDEGVEKFVRCFYIVYLRETKDNLCFVDGFMQKYNVFILFIIFFEWTYAVESPQLLQVLPLLNLKWL